MIFASAGAITRANSRGVASGARISRGVCALSEMRRRARVAQAAGRGGRGGGRGGGGGGGARAGGGGGQWDRRWRGGDGSHRGSPWCRVVDQAASRLPVSCR